MANTNPHMHAQDRPGKAVDINPAPSGMSDLAATIPWEAFDPTHPDHAEWVEDVGRCFGTHDHAQWVAAGCPIDDED